MTLAFPRPCHRAAGMGPEHGPQRVQDLWGPARKAPASTLAPRRRRCPCRAEPARPKARSTASSRFYGGERDEVGVGRARTRRVHLAGTPTRWCAARRRNGQRARRHAGLAQPAPRLADHRRRERQIDAASSGRACATTSPPRSARYKGQVRAWDVVNEAFEQDGMPADTLLKHPRPEPHRRRLPLGAPPADRLAKLTCPTTTWSGMSRRRSTPPYTLIRQLQAHRCRSTAWFRGASRHQYDYPGDCANVMRPASPTSAWRSP